ncbi:MAG: cytochrome C oxidase subunit IV family protein [Chitinophagaceae bacterium]|nr:cytochrome C oxidase subunit IV family protein [Chitinophagaceae bacterium]
MSLEHTEVQHAEEHEGMTKRRIWKVFFILLAITVVEFIVALGIPHSMMGNGVRNTIYITLTLVKAFYIIAFFMHLKFEKYTLKLILILSIIFIIYFIVLMLVEGNYLNAHMNA